MMPPEHHDRPEPGPEPPADRRPAGLGARLRGAGSRLASRVGSRRRARRTARAVGILAVVLGGTAIGTALTPPVTAQVGPLTVDVRVAPSLRPGVQLQLPPAGEVTFRTHLAPIAVEAGISEVDPEGARALISSPTRVRALQAEAPDVLRTAAERAAVLGAGFALAGAVGLSLLVHRTHWRRTGQVAATAVGLLTATAGAAALTFNSDRLAQPHFEGLLSRAPYVVSQTSGLVQRLESYRNGLADVVQSVTTLYATSGDLPVIPGRDVGDVVTVLHVSDLHNNPLGFDLTERLVRQFGVDAVVDTGDISSWGTDVEAALLARIRDVRVPYVFVRGNHDSVRTERAVAANPNGIVLDARVVEVAGLAIAGLGDPRFTPDNSVNPATTGEDPEVVAGRRLARVIQDWDAAHPGRRVAVAAFHEPVGTPPLDGVVPLVLAGHMHTRSVKEYPGGTRLLVEGSTGGAGFDALTRPGREPVPLTASVLYFARTGPRAGQLLAYDDVTVGGYGLASVSLERTAVRPGQPRPVPPAAPSDMPSDMPSGTLPTVPSISATPGARTIRPAPSR